MNPPANGDASTNQTFGTRSAADHTETSHSWPAQQQPVAGAFEDRRSPSQGGKSPGLERRQFSDSHDSLSADAAELGRAIDQYKLVNRRRYVSYEELLGIVASLGYSK